MVTTATTQSVHMSQQEADNWNPHPTDPLPIQTDDPLQLDVNWESVVDSLGKVPKQDDVDTTREKCQAYLTSLSLQVSRCDSVSSLLSALAKLREANVLLSLSLSDESIRIANDTNTSIPANKKVLPQRTKTKIYPTSKQRAVHTKCHLAKPTRKEKNEIKRTTLLSSWLRKKYTMPRKDYGIFIYLCPHVYQTLQLSMYHILQLHNACFVTKQPCLNLREMVDF